MNRLAGAYNDQEFGIVSINFKEDAEHILAFLKRVEVDFPVLLDRNGAVSARWKVFAFPSTFLLDHNGNVRYSVNTAIEWDNDEVKAVIDQLLREAKADRMRRGNQQLPRD
jgi:peroxiredoxin